MNNDHYTTDDLIDYLHGELEPALDARIHAHLATCTPCRDEYEAELQLRDALRGALAADERELPPMVKAVVWERIRSARAGWSGVFSGLRPAVAFPVAAAVAVALYFGVPVINSTHSTATTVAASYYLAAHAAESVDTPLADRTPTLSAISGSPVSERAATSSDAISAATLDDTQTP